MKNFIIKTKINQEYFTFLTTYGLFSYRKLDEGTRLLCDSIKIGKGHSYLDLGCGYGPIGIFLAKKNPGAKVIMVDRDFVAVEYAKQNCEKNSIDNCEVFLSNMFSELGKRRFDLIVANLPSHISNEFLSSIFKDSLNYLNKDAKIYIVGVSNLAPFYKRELRRVFGNYKKVISRGKYTVHMCECNR